MEKRENTAPNRFREYYEAGDINKVKELLGTKLGELEYLQHHGGTIWPFLSSIGYKEKIW